MISVYVAYDDVRNLCQGYEFLEVAQHARTTVDQKSRLSLKDQESGAGFIGSGISCAVSQDDEFQFDLPLRTTAAGIGSRTSTADQVFSGCLSIETLHVAISRHSFSSAFARLLGIMSARCLQPKIGNFGFVAFVEDLSA